MMKPFHKHDCTTCTYIRSEVICEGDRKYKVDWYICRRDIIARTGEGSSYWSAPIPSALEPTTFIPDVEGNLHLSPFRARAHEIYMEYLQAKGGVDNRAFPLYAIVRGERGEGYVVQGIYSDRAKALKKAHEMAKANGLEQITSDEWEDTFCIDYIKVILFKCEGEKGVRP